MLVLENPGLTLDELTAIGVEKEPGMDPKMVKDSIRRALKKIPDFDH